jgi:predicted metal-dependent phosphoesterase TrpH
LESSSTGGGAAGMKMKNSDLHVHSYYSDGELSPTQVVRLAKTRGIKNLALADHNSILGIEEAVNEGRKIGTNVIPAVEIAAKEDEVLGYFVNYKNPKLNSELNRTSFYENQKIKLRIKVLQKKEFDINYKDFVKRFPNSKENYNIAHLASFLSENYNIDRGKALEFIRGLKIKKPRKKNLTVIQVIKLILKYGGIPVLAHPWINLDSKELLKEQNFKKLVKSGLKGIEIDNGDRDSRRDEQTLKKIKQLAKKYNLIITSGSDFHGDFLVRETNCHDLGDYNSDEKIDKELEKLRGVKD